MNSFRLHDDPVIAASWHCDRHEPKMILETGQFLSAVWHRYGQEFPGIYKLTHKNHPVTLWAGDSTGNYNWSVALMLALNAQRVARGKLEHATITRLAPYILRPPEGVPEGPDTPHPMCMPEECKVPGDVPLSYRRYYLLKAEEWRTRAKPIYMTYKDRVTPFWINQQDKKDAINSDLLPR